MNADDADSVQPTSTKKKLKLRRETLQLLSEDLLNLQAESLWTCPGDALPEREPETFIEFDGERAQVYGHVQEKQED